MGYAVPNYVKQNIKSKPNMPPGHWFTMFYPGYTGDFKVEKEGKAKSLSQIKNSTGAVISKPLVERQEKLANKLEAFMCPVKLTAPLAVGLGNEHPVENGFAFLNPYGVPYMAGSGIKGVMRKAAELIALFPSNYEVLDFGDTNLKAADINMVDVWLLFGFEGDGASYWSCSKSSHSDFVKAMKEQEKIRDSKRFKFFSEKAFEKKDKEKLTEVLFDGKKDDIDKVTLQGALRFWDGIPESGRVEVEIMTPHYGHYLNADNEKPKAPHEQGQPNPIPFLVVPSGANMNLIVEVDEKRLPENYDWRVKLKAIVDFASKLLGFGAKTAMGYGAFVVNETKYAELADAMKERKKQQLEEERLASMSPEDRAKAEIENELNTLAEDFKKLVYKEKSFNPGSSGLRKFLPDIYDVCEKLKNEEGKQLLEDIRAFVKDNRKMFREVRDKIAEIYSD